MHQLAELLYLKYMCVCAGDLQYLDRAAGCVLLLRLGQAHAGG